MPKLGADEPRAAAASAISASERLAAAARPWSSEEASSLPTDRSRRTETSVYSSHQWAMSADRLPSRSVSIDTCALAPPSPPMPLRLL